MVCLLITELIINLSDKILITHLKRVVSEATVSKNMTDSMSSTKAGKLGPSASISMTRLIQRFSQVMKSTAILKSSRAFSLKMTVNSEISHLKCLELPAEPKRRNE